MRSDIPASTVVDGRLLATIMLNLYRGTPVQVKPSTPSSTVYLQIPFQEGSFRRSRNATSNTAADLARSAKNEKSFTRQYLASQSSIYFRSSKAYPRSFYWKVIGEDKVLEVRCADLTRSEHDQKEAHLTLKFEFQESIISNGVAFADPDNADILTIFVITSNKELHTLLLPTEFFRNTKASAGNVCQWCSTIVPSSFMIDNPHRLYANTPFELFISFESGRLQRLTRTAEEKEWTQDNYDDKTWTASIRGMVSRRGIRTIESGSRVLDPCTAHGIIASSDSTFVYTVCLNHTLRVWNLTTGKLVVSKDLLDKLRQPQDPSQLNPGEPCVVRLFQARLMDHPILVTYSPLAGGQFKFWDIKGGLTDLLTVEDKFPGATLNPPDPDPSGNTIWSLTGFDIKPGSTSKPTELWVLWRNNNHHRLYSVHFDVHTLPEAWETNWVQCATDFSNKVSPPDFVRYDPSDTTQKWTDYLFWPGRYTTEVLETSLVIYQDATASRPTASQKNRSLQERLSASIAAKTMLRKYAEADMDYEHFTSDTDAQWRNYWRIVETISEARQAPLSLVLDKFADIPWVSMADQCCAIRECSKSELLAHNNPERAEKLETVARARWPHRRVSAESGESLQQISALAKIAGTFRAAFSPELLKDIRTALDEEMLQEAETPMPVRIIDFYERCNFSDAISNETYEQLVAALEHTGGLNGLSNELVFALLDTLPEKVQHSKSALRSTVFGSDFIIAGLQDTIMLGRQLTFDLLVLVVFLECEINQEENQMPELDAPELFSQLLSLLKEYEKNLWLISHMRQAPLELLGSDNASNAARRSADMSAENSTLVTILYDTLGKDIRPQPATDRPQSFCLTEIIEDVEAHLSGADDMRTEDGPVYIQCNLIAQQNIELATDFLRFQPKTAWSTYIKGRLSIARSDFDQAGFYFRKAAYSLGELCQNQSRLQAQSLTMLGSGKAVGPLNEMSAGLLSMMDVECFHSGLPRYFQHVLALFETAKAFGHAVQFANLALQSLQPGQKEPRVAFKSEILSRLFTAELKCSRFSAAFTALAQFTDLALQRSSMVSLVDAIFSSTSANAGLVSGLQLIQNLPIGLHPRLSRHIDQHLANLAKKQTSIPGLSNSLWSSDGQVDHLRILHAFRIAQDDYRGAVAVLLDRLQLIKKSSYARNDPQAVQLRQTLLALINAMSCVSPDEAYLLTDLERPIEVNGNTAGKSSGSLQQKESKRRRVIVTLDDLRREYQQLLDKCSRIERGDFDFQMDEHGSDDDEDEGFYASNRISSGDAMEI